MLIFNNETAESLNNVSSKQSDGMQKSKTNLTRLQENVFSDVNLNLNSTN